MNADQYHLWHLSQNARARRDIYKQSSASPVYHDEDASKPIAPEMIKKAESKMVTRQDRILRAYGGTGPRHSILGRDDEPRSYDPEVV